MFFGENTKSVILLVSIWLCFMSAILIPKIIDEVAKKEQPKYVLYDETYLQSFDEYIMLLKKK